MNRFFMNDHCCVNCEDGYHCEAKDTACDCSCGDPNNE